MIQVSLRLPEGVLEILDEYARRLSENDDGRRPATRADAARILINEGIRAVNERGRKK